MTQTLEDWKKKVHDTITTIGYANINEGVIDGIVEQVWNARTDEVVEIVGPVDTKFLQQPDAEEYLAEWAINKDRERIITTLTTPKISNNN